MSGVERGISMKRSNSNKGGGEGKKAYICGWGQSCVWKRNGAFIESNRIETLFSCKQQQR